MFSCKLSVDLDVHVNMIEIILQDFIPETQFSVQLSKKAPLACSPTWTFPKIPPTLSVV